MFVLDLEDCVPDYALGGPYFVDDRNFRASSELPGFESWNARLKPGRDHRQLSAWMPSTTDTSPWIEVDYSLFKCLFSIIFQKQFMSGCKFEHKTGRLTTTTQ